MESEELPTTDNRYGVRLKIKSEEDLFVIDERLQEPRNTLL